MGITSVGATMVMIAGSGVSLATSQIATVVAMLFLGTQHLGLWAALLIALAASVALSAAQGAVIGFWNADPIVLTIAGGFAIGGVATWFSGGTTVYPAARQLDPGTELWMMTPRALRGVADRNGYTEIIHKAGGRLLTDSCPAMSKSAPEGTRVFATDSAKQAHYLPAILGIEAWFGTLEDCVEAAVTSSTPATRSPSTRTGASSR